MAHFDNKKFAGLGSQRLEAAMIGGFEPLVNSIQRIQVLDPRRLRSDFSFLSDTYRPLPGGEFMNVVTDASMVFGDSAGNMRVHEATVAEADGVYRDKWVFYVGPHTHSKTGKEYEVFHFFTFYEADRIFRDYRRLFKYRVASCGIRGEPRPIYAYINTFWISADNVRFYLLDGDSADAYMFQYYNEAALCELLAMSVNYKPILVDLPLNSVSGFFAKTSDVEY